MGLAGKVLKLHKSLILEEFKVYSDFNHQWESDIDEWLKFAPARGVRILKLDLSWEGSSLQNFERIDNYALPFNKNPRSSCRDISVGRLKEACFTCVDVSGEALEFLLSNCPLLERLMVSESNVLLNGQVTNSDLRLEKVPSLVELRVWQAGSLSVK
ncbi:hypothetical protein LguiA_020532 [Lonicera macranthoides]